MNTNPVPTDTPAPTTVELSPVNAPLPDPLLQSSPQPEIPDASRGGRAHGKIARLPKSVRDQINHWLLDGLPYAEIIQRLGDHGNGLTLDNISQWKKRSFQDWLAEQAFIERTRARQETPAELVRDFDATQVNHAALQLGTLHIFEALRDLGPGSLSDKLGGDCAAFARLINALARASRETMLVQKYREACARARAALRQLKDPKRKLTDDERHHLILQVDEILGLPIDDEAETAKAESPESATTPPAAPVQHEGGITSPTTGETPPETAAAA